MNDPAARSKARAAAARRRGREADRLILLIVGICAVMGAACLTLWLALTFGGAA